MKKYRSKTSLTSWRQANPMAFRITPAALALLLALFANPAYAVNQLPYYNGPEFTPHWLETQNQTPDGFHSIPDFSLSNQLGETVTEETIADKVYVASFFFSTCPGICPAIRSKLAKVQHAFLNNDRVLLLSHSIRPSTDTPEVLREYANEHGVINGKWHLLTGPRQNIYNLAKSAYFANEDLGDLQDLADFLHTENLLLIDKNRRIRGIYNGLSQSSVDHLIGDINALLANDNNQPATP